MYAPHQANVECPIIPPEQHSLNSSSVLTPVYHTDDTTDDVNAPNLEVLGGLYNLKLESADFTDLGVYTLHIRPKQIRTTITDCGVLASLPSVRGLVIDLSNVPSGDRSKFTPQGLIGYRIEYINTENKKVTNFYRLVTSSFYCTPVVSNLSSTTQKAIRYRYTDNNTNLIFCTLSPSSAPTNKPNAVPFIGQPDQDILISNTYFNPITLDIEVAEHDFSTIAIALYGNQTKSIDDGIYTMYDTNNNIYRQYNLYEIRDQFNELLYEVRQDRGSNIDYSKNFSNITQ